MFMVERTNVKHDSYNFLSDGSSTDPEFEFAGCSEAGHDDKDMVLKLPTASVCVILTLTEIKGQVFAMEEVSRYCACMTSGVCISSLHWV